MPAASVPAAGAGSEPPRPTEPVGGVDALAADGAIIRIRPAWPSDAAALTDLHARASDDTLFRRFLSAGRHPIAGEVARLVRPPSADHAALVAADRGRIVGAASYEVLPGGTEAEFAVFVDDACHGRGIGTLLLEHLAVRARRHGIPDLLGEVLPSNSPMLRVAAGLGQPMRSRFDEGLIEVHLDTAISGTDTVDARDLAAARHSLGSLFAPRCVAVFTGPDPSSDAILAAIVAGGFTGTVCAVGARTIPGVPLYSSAGAVLTAPDLAIIGCPAEDVAAAVRAAAAAGARTAIVLTPGFGSDADRSGLVRTARAAGVRLVGPGSLGVLNTDPAVRLRATVTPIRDGGHLAVAAQSGAVGVSLLAQAAEAELGIAGFVSLGAKADVSGNDLLSYWYDDPAVHAVALYLESLGNPRRFARVARAVARRKPVLVVKSGRGSGAGGVAADPDTHVAALFAHAGVIRCDGLGDLLGTARVLIGQPLPAGDRIAIIGNSGGINVLCADAAASEALSVPVLPAGIQAAIRADAPGRGTAVNPVDLGPAAGTGAIRAAIATVVPEVDALVLAFGATPGDDVPAILAALADATVDLAIPAVAVLLGFPGTPAVLGARRIPVYRQPEAAISALGRAAAYERWRATPLGERPPLDGIDAIRARRLVRDALRTDGPMGTGLAAELLDCYGIRMAATPGVPPGVALCAAVVHDALFGSVISCGLQGIATDLLGDRAVRSLPVTDRDAAAMWRELRAAPMLTGYRGSVPVDTAAVEDLLMRLGRLAEDLPEVAGLVLDPVVAGPGGVAVAGATVRLAPVGTEPDAGLRALREPPSTGSTRTRGEGPAEEGWPALSDRGAGGEASA